MKNSKPETKRTVLKIGFVLRVTGDLPAFFAVPRVYISSADYIASPELCGVVLVPVVKFGILCIYEYITHRSLGFEKIKYRHGETMQRSRQGKGE
jgi:hypothetical protein